MTPWIICGMTLVVVTVLGIGVWAQTAPRPTQLGVMNGRLTPCPATPNCVSTQGDRPSQRMALLPYTTSREAAQARLCQIVRAIPRAIIVVDQPGYVAVEFRSAWFGFIDDVEFAFDEPSQGIHFRAAARRGVSDFGVNRARMVAISRAFRAIQP